MVDVNVNVKYTPGGPDKFTARRRCLPDISNSPHFQPTPSLILSVLTIMSSGFVSAGTNEEPVERDDAWLRAQQELEEERRRKAEISQQNGGKSLFEVLEQNKSESQRRLSDLGSALYDRSHWRCH